MRQKVIKFEVIATAISFFVGLILHVVTEQWSLAISVALALEVLIHLIVFTFRYGAQLERIEEACPEDDIHPLSAVTQMRRNSIPIQLLSEIPKEWCLQERFDAVLKQLRQDLTDLSKQHYTVPMDDVLDLSLRAYERLRFSAFCTALDKHVAIFKTARGVRLKEANYAATKRLTNSGAFTRLFILHDRSSVTEFVYEFMHENAAHGIEVLVIERLHLEKLFKDNYLSTDHFDDQLDFGLWDDRYLMRITGEENARFLHVSAAKDELDEARRIISLLKDKAYSLSDYCARLREPINGLGSGWSTQPEKILDLPPPNGPHEEDAAKMFEVVRKTLKDGASLGILGLTNMLIENAKVLKSEKDFQNIAIDVIDVREYRPPYLKSPVRFQHANWLDWKPSFPYQIVIGDDILCNLAVWQLPMFFKSLAGSMEGDGLFVVRTTAIFLPHLMHPTRDEIVQRLRDIRNAIISGGNPLSYDLLNQTSIYEIAWPMLHSNGYYDEVTSMFHLGEWDQLVKKEFGADTNFANRLILPYKVSVTSMDYGNLQKMARPWFEIAQTEIEVHSVWETPEYNELPWSSVIASTFRQYYRILTFKKT